MDDERKGKRSASKAWVDFNCQPAEAMEAKAEELGQLPVEDEQWKERGTKVHEAAEMPEKADLLTADERRARDSVMARADELAEKFGDGREYTELKEYRFWIGDSYSGKPDRVRFYSLGPPDIEALLQEYKPGFLAEWEMWQAQVEAGVACVASNTGAERVTAQIITRFHGVETIVFEKQGLETALEHIRLMLERQADPETKVNPGPWCNRCAGRLICKAAALSLYPTSKMMFEGQAFETLPSGHTGAMRLSIVLKAKKIAEQIEAYYRRQLELDPDFLAGEFSLKPGIVKRKIEDVAGAWTKLSGSISEEEFLAACKVSVTKIEESYIEKQRALARLDGNKLTIKEAKQRFNDRLGDLVLWREDAPSLIENKLKIEKP